jgi:hypothetical protein
MKHLTNPANFPFTNRYGGPHFNKSLLYSRITMMNRQSSRRSWWRYGAVSCMLILTVMCQPLVRSESAQQESDVIHKEEMIINTTSHVGDTIIIESYKKEKLVDRTKVWDVDKHVASTWTGSMNQLLEASFFKRKEAMLYVRPDHHLDLYDEYKKSVTVFVDRKEVTLEELKTVHIRQVAVVYAHRRSSKEDLLGLSEDYNAAVIHGQKPNPKLRVVESSTRRLHETDYIVWIDRAPNRMKRDSTIHIVSPFYTGDF